MSEFRKIVLCKDCIHRPTVIECEDDVKDNIEFPDEKCPCRCEDDWYSWSPADDFYCAHGEECNIKMPNKYE